MVTQFCKGANNCRICIYNITEQAEQKGLGEWQPQMHPGQELCSTWKEEAGFQAALSVSRDTFLP